MKIIKTQNKKQQKTPTNYSILYSELVPLSRDVNALQTLEIQKIYMIRNCQWNTGKSWAQFSFGTDF